MNDLMIPGTTDKLVIPAEPAISRRDVLKRLGAGGLAVAAGAVLVPRGAAAADGGWWPDLPSLIIKRSVRDAVIAVDAYPMLLSTAIAEIRSGTYRYGIAFRLLTRSNKTVREWTFEPLPATVRVDGDSTIRMGYSALLSYGTTFQVRVHLYKKRRGSDTKIPASSTVGTTWVTIKPAHGTAD